MRPSDTFGQDAPQPRHDASVKVQWSKTLAAWLMTSAVVLAFRVLIAPESVGTGNWRMIIVASLIWLAATVMMVVTHYTLHSAQCVRLRHYVFSYPVVVSPILLQAFVEGYLVQMLGMSLFFAPVVVVFWCFYALVLKGVSGRQRDMSEVQALQMQNHDSVRGSVLAIGIAVVGILVLNHMTTLMAASLLAGEEGHESLLWGGALPALVMLFWGGVVRFVVVKCGYTGLGSYTIGFLMFVLGYVLFDLMTLVAALVILVLGMFAEGGAAVSSGSSETFWDRAPEYVVYCIFPAVIVAGGLILWWAYHVAVPRILPSYRSA